jgi:hypothetical protein
VTRRSLIIAVAIVLGAAACGAASAGASTVWLCRPGLARNPCTSSQTTTVIDAHGRRHVVHSRPAAHPKIDCFYVYPTVSGQSTTNANLTTDPQETVVAIDQASRFSSVCRVYAPMYPQLTLKAILTPGGITPVGAAIAYGGVLSAFRDYLAHDNHGRGIVFLGHSQGSSMLIPLLAHEVDGVPGVRKLLVSAVLLGGDVTVKRGKGIGGDFAHIPACRSVTQTGCVVAYSTFEGTPPANSLFGRVGGGINPFAPRGGGLQVLCTNPAALRGGTATLLPYFISASVPGLKPRGPVLKTPATPWVSFPGQYTARCRTAGGATWLDITPDRVKTDHRPVVTASPGPRWGLHRVDVNLALGNLVGLVGREAAAYVAHRR